MPRSDKADEDRGDRDLFQPERMRDLGDLAARALSVVAARTAGHTKTVNDRLIDRLLEAAMGRSKESYRGVARHMLSMGIAPEYIVDEYIPAVARRMGDEWCDDKSSFAAVTIGGSRLQALLRELSTFWKADDALISPNDGASALVMVPPREQHTLGAAVLATQLRRIGLSVRLSVGPDMKSLAQTMASSAFDAVIISSAGAGPISNIRDMVNIARNAGSGPTPKIVVGGTMLQLDNIDIRRETGADLASVDLAETLDFCKIAAPRTQL